MGNHTDYNEGFVISVALDKKVYISGGKRDDGKGVVYSSKFDSTCEFNVNDPRKQNGWGDYVKGVVSELNKRGVELSGFSMVIDSTVPVGTGLSSSAALEVAVALFLKTLFPYDMAPFDMARMCRCAENNFVGMNCGILDQFSSIFGKKNSALFLDCRSEEYDIIPLNRDDIAVVICNSMEKHELISSQYNIRREECFRAAEYFRTLSPEVSMLRDIPVDLFEKHQGEMDENEMKRARHVIYENQRVIEGRDTLLNHDLKRFGKLMDDSHKSSREWFENSTDKLDFLQKTAMGFAGVIGAKLSGGGFGGSVVVIVEKDSAKKVQEELDSCYTAETGIKPEIYLADISDGAKVL